MKMSLIQNLQRYMSPACAAMLIVLLFFLAAILVLSVHVYRLNQQKEDMARQLNITRLQVDALNQQLQNIEEEKEHVRRMRHDLRHNLLPIRRYAEEMNYEAIKQYLDDYIKSCHFETVEPLCENLAVDAVIRHYIGIARQAGIQTDIAIHVPQKLSISEQDVCVMIGNLLENAVEACCRDIRPDSFLEIKMSISKSGNVAIVVKNSYSGTVVCQNGTLFSAKRSGAYAGVGISSIRYIVKKYHGTADFQYDEKKFCASVWMKPC